MDKKFISIFLLATLFCVASVPVTAQDSESGAYLGVNYAFLDAELSSIDFNTPMIFITPGYQINPFLPLKEGWGSVLAMTLLA